MVQIDEKVGIKVKKIFRYRLNTIFLIIGFCIASVAFHYSMGTYVSKDGEDTDIKKCSFKEGACFVAVPTVDGYIPDNDILNDDIDALLKNIEGESNTLIYILQIVPYINEQHGMASADIYLSGPMPKYDFVYGGFPSEEVLSSGNLCVVLGINKKDYTYRRNGKYYIKIEGEEYLVTGFVSAENSRILDNEVLLFYTCVGNNVKDSLYNYYLSGTLGINYESDVNTNVYTLMKNYVDKCPSDTYTFYVSQGAMDKNYSTAVKNPVYKLFSDLIYIFCIVMIFFVIEFWMMRRKEEFAIRKAFGYTNAKLFKMIFYELLCILLAAIVLSETFLAVLSYLNTGLYVLEISDIYNRFVMEVIFGVVTLFSVSISPLLKLLKYRPAQLMSEVKT